MTQYPIVSGEVISGNRIGRQLGFPTANISLEETDGIRDGVYAVKVEIEKQWKNGVANVGARPTVTDNPARLLEVYIFDFDREIYGKTIRVKLIGFIRPEQKFAAVEALRRQIEQDKRQAEIILEKHTNHENRRNTGL